MSKWWLCGALLLALPAWSQPDVHRTDAHPPDSTRAAFATGRLPVPMRRTPARFLSLSGSGGFDANTLYNDLVMGLYNGDRLSRSLRERSQDALNGRNRGGYALDLSVAYAWGTRFFGSDRWRPRITVADHHVLGLRFRDPVYDLTFFGNAAYEGRTARLAPSAFEQVSYQTVAFGAEEKRTRSYIQLAVVNGQSLNAAHIDRADLFTAVDGRYLELGLDGGYWRSDTAGGAFGGSNGLGAALELGLILPVQVGRTTGELGFSATDVGFIAWNGNSLRVPRDTTLHYRGIRVEDVLDLEDLPIGKNGLQDTLGLAYERGAFVRALPALLEAHLALGTLRATSMPNTFAYTLGVDHRCLPGYVPFVSLRRTFGLGADACAHVQAAYGGFGGFRAGVGAKVRLLRHALLTVASPNVIGSVSDAARGKAVLVGLDVAW